MAENEWIAGWMTEFDNAVTMNPGAPHLRVVFMMVCTLLLPLTVIAQAGSSLPPDAETAQALALEQAGKSAEAEAAWRLVVKAHPASAAPYAHLGLLEARQEHYQEAVSFYRKALALNPAMPGLHLNLGLALFKDGQMRAAIEQFTPLKAKAKDAAEVQRYTVLLGMAHYGLGEYQAAAPFLKEAAAADPGNLQLRLALAHSCLWSKQYQCVLDTTHEMLALNANSAEVDMLAGEAEDEMKDYDGAIEQFRAAVKADPRQPDVHFGLGYLLWTQRRYPEAETELKAELANNPRQAMALTYLADTEMQLNHADLAPPLLEQALTLNGKLELAHLDLGILYSDSGRKEQALHELKSAADLAPDDVNVHWRLGRLYRTMGKAAEAKAEFDKASRLHEATNNALLERMKTQGDKPQPAGPATEQP